MSAHGILYPAPDGTLRCACDSCTAPEPHRHVSSPRLRQRLRPVGSLAVCQGGCSCGASRREIVRPDRCGFVCNRNARVIHSGPWSTAVSGSSDHDVDRAELFEEMRSFVASVAHRGAAGKAKKARTLLARIEKETKA